ncbi:MAG: DUF481 domain-containing protein [Epsilonproteobacteria bacterium]|nr:DUF481 domain-containing protein [Campylobacterota bacterium]
MKKIALSLTLIAFGITVAYAEDLQEKPLKTHTELGYVATNGNTDTETFTLDLNAKKEWARHIATLDLEGQYATDKGVQTKNKYLIEVQYDYKFSERLSFNYLAGYKADKFSGFTYQLYTGPGIKYKAIKTDKHELSLDGNILYAKDRYDAVAPQQAYTNDYTSYRSKGVYTWQILQSLKFLQKLSFRGSFEESNNYFIDSKTALTNKISDTFSAGISYKINYANQPAEGKKKTDTTFAFNLIIDY